MSALGKRSSKPGGGLAIAFLRRLIGHVGDECVTWPFCTDNGYGLLGYHGETHYAHRMMCRLAHGEPPSPEHEAAHSCGHGDQACINPNHLSWKTCSENQLDRAAHGTKNVWSRRGKLTPEKAEQIRELKGKKPQREIAEMFGVSRSQISWVMTGRAWVNLPKGIQHRGKTWTARIKIAGREIHIGTFKTESAATAAYQKANADARAALSSAEPIGK